MMSDIANLILWYDLWLLTAHRPIIYEVLNIEPRGTD